MSLSAVMASVKKHSAHAINALLQRRGALWRRGFHDQAVRREEDLVRLAQYVVENPIRAGLVRSVGDYALWDAMWL